MCTRCCFCANLNLLLLPIVLVVWLHGYVPVCPCLLVCLLLWLHQHFVALLFLAVSSVVAFTASAALLTVQLKAIRLGRTVLDGMQHHHRDHADDDVQQRAAAAARRAGEIVSGVPWQHSRGSSGRGDTMAGCAVLRWWLTLVIAAVVPTLPPQLVNAMAFGGDGLHTSQA